MKHGNRDPFYPDNYYLDDITPEEGEEMKEQMENADRCAECGQIYYYPNGEKNPGICRECQKAHINKNFIKEMEIRLETKEGIKTDYRDRFVTLRALWQSLKENASIPDSVIEKESLRRNRVFVAEAKKELVDIANLCWMIWEKIDEKEK